MTPDSRIGPVSAKVEIREARTAEDFALVRALFEEYASTLGFDLAFQGFDRELESLPGEYAAPRGLLLLAWNGKEAVGCVGLRPFGPDGCEMKRLYLRPGCRGTGAGRRLAVALIEGARRRGFAWMRLDTVPGMDAAMALYRALGFREIASYRPNPVPGAVYMQLDL